MIETSSFEHARNAAKIIGYLTGSPVAVLVSDADRSKWVVDSEIDFFAALFLLRFESSQPPNPPNWWESMIEEYWAYSDRWDYLFVVTKALVLPFERNPGEAPRFTGRQNTFAANALATFGYEIHPQGYWHEGHSSNANYPYPNYLKRGFDKKMACLLLLGIEVLKISFNFEEDEQGESYRMLTIPELSPDLEIDKKMDGLAEMAYESSTNPGFPSHHLDVSFFPSEQSITYQHFQSVRRDRECFAANWSINKSDNATVSDEFPPAGFTLAGGYAFLPYCRTAVPNLFKGHISFTVSDDKSYRAHVSANAYDVGGYHYQNDPVGSSAKKILASFFSCVVNELAKPDPIGEERLNGTFSLNFRDGRIAFSIVYSHVVTIAITPVAFSFDDFIENSEHTGAVLNFGYEGSPEVAGGDGDCEDYGDSGDNDCETGEMEQADYGNGSDDYVDEGGSDFESGEMEQADWGDRGDDFDGQSWEEYMG